MSAFAAVFLGRSGDEEAAQIAGNVSILLQSISPDAAIPEELAQVRSSNLSHGTNMTWVRGDLGREDTMRLSIRERLRLFEPRFDAINDIDVIEVAERNEVTFRMRAQMRDRRRIEPFSFETRLSLLNQFVEEPGA
jgi:predicted component of type VI protein secretion system